jgi:hypothetical protein
MPRLLRVELGVLLELLEEVRGAAEELLDRRREC